MATIAVGDRSHSRDRMATIAVGDRSHSRDRMATIAVGDRSHRCVPEGAGGGLEARTTTRT